MKNLYTMLLTFTFVTSIKASEPSYTLEHKRDAFELAKIYLSRENIGELLKTSLANSGMSALEDLILKAVERCTFGYTKLILQMYTAQEASELLQFLKTETGQKWLSNTKVIMEKLPDILKEGLIGAINDSNGKYTIKKSSK
ncbi:MAG: hypothetical protein P4L22_06280 [Candidatus Babeliales bacterium]|nr:hypothetical protein [Candidatus Babeliales bacterium]